MDSLTAQRDKHKLFLHLAGRRCWSLVSRWIKSATNEMTEDRSWVRREWGNLWSYMRSRACESGRWTHSKAQCSACGWWCSFMLLQPLMTATANDRRHHKRRSAFSCPLQLHFDASPSSLRFLWIFGSFSSSRLWQNIPLFEHQIKFSLIRRFGAFSLFSQVFFICCRRIYTHPKIGWVYLSGQNLHNTATQPKPPVFSPGLKQFVFQQLI